MTNPFQHPFLTRDKTMYLSTLTKQDFKITQPYFRESSFLKNDIQGSKPKKLVSQFGRSNNLSLSTYVQPVPNTSKTIKKTSNPLYIDDIEGTKPQANCFRTKRIVDPLCPRYLLPSASALVPDNGRSFMRDTLNVKDINGKKSYDWINSNKKYAKEPIPGSNPSNQTRYLNAKSRLDVKDINKDGIFQSGRHPDPLVPIYKWRDNDKRDLSVSYGFIEGNKPIRQHKEQINRPNNYCLNTKDIQGTSSNSLNAKAHFLDKRRQFRNNMAIKDIEKTSASSLKKGITTNRQTNPLMPRYNYPGHKLFLN